MRKNFMLSLAAMAALPMAGLAETVWELGTDPKVDWTPAGETTIQASTPQDILCVGTSISYTVTLPKGNYDLNWKALSNAKLTVAWDKYNKVYSESDNAESGYTTHKLNLSEETKVTLTLDAVNKGQFQISGLFFKLNFGFTAAYTKLVEKLGSYSVSVKDGSYAYEGGATTLFQQIQKLPDEIKGTTVNFENLKSTLLAKGRAQYDLFKGFKDVEDINAKDAAADGKAAFELYKSLKLWKYGQEDATDIEKALAGIERVLTVCQKLDDIKTGIQSELDKYDDIDNAAKAYTKTVYQPVVDKFVQGINDELAKLEENYKDDKLPTDTYIKENFGDTKDNLTKSFELHKGIKQAFIDAEDVYTKEKANIAEAQATFEKENNGYWKTKDNDISGALYNKAIDALDREHTPVVDALSAFNSIILDLDNNADASYKALVEFYKNENYVSKPSYDVKNGKLATAKSEMTAVKETYFKGENSIAKQLQGEYDKVYGTDDTDGIQDTYDYVYAANEAYKAKFEGKDIYTGMTSLLSTFKSTYLDNIASSLETSVNKISVDNTDASKNDKLEIIYKTKSSTTFTLDKASKEITDLKGKITDDTKVWADACYKLNTLLKGYQQTLNAFEKKLRAKVELSEFKGDKDNGNEALTLTQKSNVVYNAYNHWKDYAFEGENSLNGKLTAIATEIKGYAIKDLVTAGKLNQTKFDKVKASIDAIGADINLFDDVNSDPSKNKGICAQRATRIAATLLSKLYEWKDTYAEKEAFVANKNVFVGESRNTTYGDLLAKFNNGITALQQDVDDAEKKNGSEHYTTLSNLFDKYWTIFDDPEATYTILAKTETDYTKDAQDKDNALAVKIAEVKSQITLCKANAKNLYDGLTALKGKLVDHEGYKAVDTYGKKLAELKGTAGVAGTDSYEGIMQSFDDLDNFDPSKAEESPAKDIYIYTLPDPASLDLDKANEAEKTVKEDIQSVLSLTAALNALNKKAESVAAAVELNKTLHTRYTSWCNTGTYKNDAGEDVKVLDDGFIKQAKKILNTNIDGTKQEEMQKAYDKIEKDVKALLEDLNKYLDEETLSDNASDIETRLGNILADVNNLDKDVAKYNYNHSAHIWLNNYFAKELLVEVYDPATKKTEKIPYAQKVYNDLYTDTASATESEQIAHNVFAKKANELYLGSWTYDEGSHNGLENAIEGAYKDYKITEARKNELKGKIDALKANIKKVKDNCDANDTQYGKLTDIYDYVYNAYTYVSTTLTASEVQAKWKKAYDDKDIEKRINRLRDGDNGVFAEKYPLEYNGYTYYYKLGQFVDGTTDPYTHYKKLLDAVKTDKDNIDKIYDGSNHNEVIASNKTLHANFLEQYDAAVRRYEQIIESLNEYMNSGANKEDVANAMNALYTLRTGLDVIKTDEANAYWEIFNKNNSLDEKKGDKAVALPATHLNKLNEKKGEIEKTYLENVTKFNTDAIAQFTKAFKAATEAVAEVVKLDYKDGKYVVDAKAETATAGYEPEAVAKAYSAITDVLTAERNEGYDVDNKTLTDGRLVYNLSSHLANLAEVTSLLTTAEQQLPVCQVQIWEVAMLDMDGKIQSLFKEYKSLATGEVDGTDYQTAFNDGFAAFKNAVAAGTPTADNIGSVKNAYTTTKKVYGDFTKMIGNKEKSEYYYEKFLAEIKTYGYIYEGEDGNTPNIQKCINDVVDHLRTFITVEGKGMFACTTSIDKLENDLKTIVDAVALQRGKFNFHNYYNDYKELAKQTLAKTLYDLRNNSIKIDNDRTPVNTDELEFLTKQLTSLQAYLFSEIKDTDLYKKYSSEITAATAKLPDPNKVAWKDLTTTRDNLLERQKEVSDLRTRMTGFNAEEKQKELVAAVNTVGETYTSATETIATLFKFQQEDIKNKNLEAKDGAAAYKDSVMTDYKNGILVFNADTYAAEIEKAAKAMEVFALKVQAYADAKATHENTCDKIVGMLQSDGDYGKRFAELQAKMAGFDETVQEKFAKFVPYYEANAANRAAYYAAVKAKPENNKLLKGNEPIAFDPDPELNKIPQSSTRAAALSATTSPVPNSVANFEDFFNYVDKECSKAEVDVRIKNFAESVKVLCDRDEETLTDYEGLKALIYAGIIKADPQYIVNYDELDKAVKAQYKLINKAYKALYGVELGVDKSNSNSKGYIDYAYEDQIISDIDGNPIENEQGYIRVDFVADCLQEIFDKIDELNATIDKVIADTEANIYYRGDIDHDKVVDVNDFASLKLHILGYAEHQLEGMKLLAADTNADGKVNIGDLTRMVTMILNNERYAAPAREAANTGINDALAVMTEGEGVHQRIGIMLDAERVYAGCQMDILLPEGVTLVSESLGEMADGLSLSSNDLENGYHRVVLSSFDGAAMNTGNGAMLWLDVEVGHNYSGEGIELSNILFSNGAGRTFELSVASGETTGLSNVSMTQEVKEKIYNVGGILMDSLKRGVNIIRGNDGSSKKIVK